MSRVQLQAPEVLDENRFLAARDGVGAELIDVVLERRMPVEAQLDELLGACLPHARHLGCEVELERCRRIAATPPAARQIQAARGSAERLPGLVHELAAEFSAAPTTRIVRNRTRPKGETPARNLRPVSKDAAHPRI